MHSYHVLILVLIVLCTLITFSTNSNYQTSRQRLEQGDALLNSTIDLFENMTSDFLTTGNVTLGKYLLNLTQQCIINKRLFLYKTRNLFKNKSILERQDRLEDLVTGVRQMEAYMKDLEDILDISVAADWLYQNISNLDCDISESTSNYSLENLKKCSELLESYQESMIELQKKWESSNISSKFLFPWTGVFSVIVEKRQNLETINETVYQKQLDIMERLELTSVFQYYAYPTVYAIILAIGIVGNGTLFFIFIRHREIRTNANIMVLNLATADVLNLFVNAPVYYMIKYHNDAMYTGCKAFAVFRFLIHSLIELSVVAISGQRYFATVSAVNIGRQKCSLTPRVRIMVHITVVWVLSLIIALFPVIFVFDFPNGVCYPVMKYENWAEMFYISTFSFDCVILPILLFVFSLLTARILKRSAREMPSEIRNSRQELARYRSARVVTALAIAYIFCFIPRCLLSFIVSSQHLNTKSKTMIYLDEITNYLIFSNSCLNPIALCMASRAFRKLFNSYLFPCFLGRKNANQSQRISESRATSEVRISGEI